MWKTKGRPSEARLKFLLKLFSKSLQGVGQRPTVLPLLDAQRRKKARETAKRLSRMVAHREGGFPKAG